MKNFIIILLLIISFLYSNAIAQERMPLNGKWQFAIDPQDKGVQEKWFSKPLDETVTLPGSMTENGKGYDISLSTQWTGNILDSSYFKLPEYAKYRQPGNFKVPFWLQPVKSYVGAAWYKRKIKIPAGWNEKSIELLFERCHWQSTLWIDDKLIGTQYALGAPHIFDLTGKLTPGEHTITVCVDNRIKDINPGANSSSLTDHSQTNWNGIVGEMTLTAREKIHFGEIRIFTDINKKTASVEMLILNLTSVNQKANISLLAKPEGTLTAKQSFTENKKEIELSPGKNTITIDYEMGSGAQLWDEFNPALYKMSCKLTSKNVSDSKEEVFGLRKLGTKKIQFTVNDKIIYLRGTLECAVFPKTGYPPTDEKEWSRIFSVCKEYGLNHMRFHSWCPPKAAFSAADKAGIYLHVECSAWANQGASIGDGKPIDKYIYDESESIVKAFGNHPSFCFMLYGNEPDGVNHQKYLGDFVSYWKKKDNRRLYSAAAGWPQLDVNDFHSMYEPRIQLWGAGLSSVINSQAPNTTYDWRNIIEWRGKPVISHEIGQWCVYPNYKEIKKYDGVLKAKNFEMFKESLEENGMAQYADTFLTASGKLQVLCYKTEIEAALRTKDMGGFQLLDLHDFPGQGTALIGVLDPFWETKGYVTPDEYKQFCNTTVPLARLSKFVFNSAEDFVAAVEVSHFGADEMKDVTPAWKIVDESGKVISSGTLAKTNIAIGNGIKLGSIRQPLNNFMAPAMYTLIINIGSFNNKWDFWVYPYENKEAIFNNDIKIARQLDAETIKLLNEGGSVLLTPVKGSIKNEKGGDIAVGFSSIFWNMAWTNKQPPHTLGILCDPKNPMLKEFPTQYHSNNQWWDAMSHCNAIKLNELGSNIQPVVRIIDDWFTNRPLGLIIEAKVGKGKIVISGIDLLTDAEKRPEAKQLTYSILKYMRSSSFTPSQEIQLEKIKDLFN